MNFHFRDPDPRDRIGKVGRDGRDILGPEHALGGTLPQAAAVTIDERLAHPNDPDCLTGWKCPVATREEWKESEHRLNERYRAYDAHAAALEADRMGSRIRELQGQIVELSQIDLNPIGRKKRQADRAVRLARLERDLIDAQEAQALGRATV